MKTLAFGLVTGMLFGFLLQRGRVLRYDKQIGVLRLKDMTILKFMLSSIIVSMAGVYLLKDLGLAELRFLPTVIGSNIIGGLIFGVGWGMVGYCPGTAMGALGEGRWDALWGILGMVLGAAVFAEAYPFIKGVYEVGRLGSITLPGVLGINHWFVIAAFAAGGIALFRWFEKKGL